MTAHQKIFRERRNYNKWVANQTLEDYALRFTAKGARRWSKTRVSNTALGAISFLALEAIGGTITLSYGFTNTVVAVCVVGFIIFLTGIPISYHAAKNGIDIDLLTRGASFGYIGSTITSLIYASFTFIFFALEAAIMAMALQLTLGIHLGWGYLISAVVVIPLVTHGITFISRFQLWSQPIWILLQLLPLAFIAWHDIQSVSDWTQFEVAQPQQGGYFNLVLFGAASSVVFSLIAQIGEQVDFLRFLPNEDKPGRRWFFAMLSAGPGWILIGMLKILIGSFLAWLALSHGIEAAGAADPTRMYTVAFGYLTQSPNMALVFAGIFVVISQIKINVTNAYAGSIAWSNFFSRLTHNHPGRVVWLVFNVTIALVLMELGIYRALEDILGAYSIVALAWVGSLVADLVINRPLGLRPQEIEFKRAHLYDINPVGVGSMLIASVVGLSAHLGVWGDVPQALSSFLALATTFLVSPVIAWLTGGRYYIARPSTLIQTDKALVQCCICEHTFEHEDMAFCPAYEGPICSLCCSLDVRCNDVCKTDSRFSEQFLTLLGTFLPPQWVARINSRLGNFVGLFFLIVTVICGLLFIIYFQIRLETDVDSAALFNALIKVSFILMIICGVMSWMFVLVHESRQKAQEESQHQTQLLMAEIEAHNRTDRELQKAKEIAEAANQAKSRYLTGISHELRTPLNAILGYAQLLEKDHNIPSPQRENIGIVRRSADYLSDLIEGLLDISKIEAGRLDLVPTQVALPQLIDQLVTMFRIQAEKSRIQFHFICDGKLPKYVKVDEKRLRQILINLLSNAVKFTQIGDVFFKVRYRNQVAEFTIIDSGIGIPEEDQERIFRPFERVRKPGMPHVPGTGLGLTITKLLTEILGGEIVLDSAPGQGSTFRVSLMLSSIRNPSIIPVSQRQVIGYSNNKKTLMIVDDDPTHRGLISDMLSPLGFEVIEAPDGFACLEMIRECEPDLFLLDVSMPEMDGWDVARQLKTRGSAVPIIMVSADAREGNAEERTQLVDDYIVKPVQVNRLLETIAANLDLTWCYADELNHDKPAPNTDISSDDFPPPKDCSDLRRLAEIGFVNGIQAKLVEMESGNRASQQFIDHIKVLARGFQFKTIIEVVGEIR
jgi:signal transduction histidine kinase/CheY-like chemotaxis protein/purine-cytosine permease-like protein